MSEQRALLDQSQVEVIKVRMENESLKKRIE
jgi:hypothetical protein